MSVPRWVYHLRGVLAAPPLIVAAVWVRFEVEQDLLIWPLGMCIFLLGLALRIWAQQHVHYRLKIRRQLCTSGPYQFVRNPLYIANTLICMGLTVISELLWLVPVTLLWCATVYSFVVRNEESRLSERYGEPYRIYMSRVPRWFPRALHLRNLKLVNEHLSASVLAEIHCLLALAPYIFKEVVLPWLGH